MLSSCLTCGLVPPQPVSSAFTSLFVKSAATAPRSPPQSAPSPAVRPTVPCRAGLAGFATVREPWQAGKTLAAGILSPQFIALAEEAMKTMMGIKSKVAVIVLALTLAVSGVLSGYDALVQQAPPKAEDKQAPVVQGDPPKKEVAGPAKALHGDSLPTGAIARLGTIRCRHDSTIVFAGFHPGGKSVISASSDGVIGAWEFPSGKPIRRFETQPQAEGQGEPAGLVTKASLSPDGKHVTVFYADGSVRIWDWANAKQTGKVASGGGFGSYGGGFGGFLGGGGIGG